jgi:hypothetical protein
MNAEVVLKKKVENWLFRVLEFFYELPCCGSGIFLSRILIFVHPGSRIQKQQQKRGVKNFFCPTIFCSHINNKIENYINFELVKRKIWANLQRIYLHKFFVAIYLLKMLNVYVLKYNKQIHVLQYWYIEVPIHAFGFGLVGSGCARGLPLH